ncbi:putative Ig domain-containing protein [uncultured Methanolobus sp.]|uniref:putative Ig domain-containing protein n=1 Tax=uncultured Methanolobus sp. TaxID=218300 RepID=UPI0029C951C4|nr:putative Ig domain-containing protein [uncultured Methanolobus sp.]
MISCSTIASANIGVSSDNRIYVFHESEPVYLNDVHDQVDHSLLATDGNGIWKLNTSIYVANSTLVIDGNSGVKELRMNSDIPIKGGTSVIMGQSTTGTAGTIIIDSTKISTWNYTINEYESDYSRMRNIWLFGGSVSNTEFVAISKLEFFNDFSSTVKNVSILNSYNGLAFNNVEDILVEDITCENISFTGLLLKSCVNVEVKNYTFINSEEFWKVHDTSANGISLGGGGHGNYVHSAIINGARWGGVYFSGGEHDSKIEDVNILYAGHNGMDVHGAFNIELRNVSVSKSFSNNYMVAGTSNLPEGTYNISFIDCSSIDSNGRGMTGDWAVSDIYIDGFRASGSNSAAIQFFNASNIYITDYASSDLLIGTAIQMSSLSGYGTENVAIIDSIISDSKWKDIWFEYNNINNNIINSKWETIGKGQSSEYSDAKYLDVIAVSARTGLQVPNSVLKINDQHRSEISSTDGYSNLKDTFDLPLGRTFLPLDDRLNSPVLKNYYRAFDGHEESFSYEVALSITASESVTLTGITPDSSWYREDPNIPTYTITAIIPDDSTSGPQITGFAPSEDNPFTAGESKKFQIWSGEALTTMKWYVDSDLRSSGSMEYNWDIETGSHTIMFTGSNANGAVVQTWEVTEGEEVPVESPVSSGTGLSFTPSGSSLTANTGESTTFVVDSGQEFTSALWYLDGNLVESNTVNHAQDWNTAGTHTVRFDGTAAAGTISRTWTAVVSEPVESEYSSISISPSTNTVAPGESFSLDVYIDPAQSLTGSQFDLHYSQLASVSSVNEGGLFSSDIFATTFEYGRIDNTLGILSHVYSAIVGSGTISQAGVMATVDMVAGSDSGVLELELANVILSDASSNPAAYAASYATVLVDTAPEFTSISAKSVDEAQSLSFIVSATDADEDDLTYTAISFPSGASFDAGTATFSWTPSEGDSGNYEAVFEVTDGYLTDTVSVSITVTPLNHVPIISLFEPADNSVFEEGSTINVNVVATDADGQSLSYVIKIDGSQVSTASSYAWETGYESAGTHSIEVTVSDGIDEVSSSGTITITDLQPRWDVNEDGIVNVLDITLVGQNYGTTYTSDYPRWDVNLDGIVNIQDLSIVAGHFGETV